MTALWGPLFSLWLGTAPQSVPEPGWNTPETVTLVERAIGRRRLATGDTLLRDYRARATGHVYFLFDLGPGTARHLVKADQIALDVFWRAPGLTRQVIVGHREANIFPTRIRYHLDHLTVVTDNFGDRIRLGEGTEVRDVLHPAAPGALGFYDYRLTDSLTLRLHDGEVRVYEVQVRPKDPAQPAFVGSIYLDRASADIVRMEFTFTARSYIDTQLQYFRIVLENALWERRYWLPYRQALELRREVRWLDFPAGGVIRGEFTITDYEFNVGLPDHVFRRPEVMMLPPREREGYSFPTGLYDGLEKSDLLLQGDLRSVEAQAIELAGRRYLEGLRGRPRLLAAGSSSLLRYRRAEGLYLGLGASLDLGPWAFRALGGRAFHAGLWEGSANVEYHPGGVRLWTEVFGNQVQDVAPWPAAPGTVQSVGAIVSGEDYAEPYYASGVSLGAALVRGGIEVGVYGRRAVHEPAKLTAPETLADSLRPVRRMRSGGIWEGGIVLKSPAPAGADPLSLATWNVGAGVVGGEFSYARITGRVEGSRAWGGDVARDLTIAAALQAGGVFGSDVPPHALFPVGGRGTLRGYEFHEFLGSRYLTLTLDAAIPLVRPWMSLHGFSDVGWADLGGGVGDAVRRWNAEGAPARATRGVRPSVGLGFGFVYDVLRIEAARGLRGGTWEFIATVHPAFWPWL